MICAALQAHLAAWRKSTRKPRRKSTRKSFSQGRPLHPKGRASHFVSCASHFALGRKSFARMRKSFCPGAQVIFDEGRGDAGDCSPAHCNPTRQRGIARPHATVSLQVLLSVLCELRENLRRFCPPLSRVRRHFHLSLAVLATSGPSNRVLSVHDRPCPSLAAGPRQSKQRCWRTKRALVRRWPARVSCPMAARPSL